MKHVTFVSAIIVGILISMLLQLAFINHTLCRIEESLHNVSIHKLESVEEITPELVED